MLLRCAADGGRRVKAYRPAGDFAAAATTAARCNREDNGLELQYTLSTDMQGGGQHAGMCAGLHVVGTKVMCVTGVCVRHSCARGCLWRAPRLRASQVCAPESVDKRVCVTGALDRTQVCVTHARTHARMATSSVTTLARGRFVCTRAIIGWLCLF